MLTTFLEVVRSRYYSSIHHERIGKGSTAAKLLLHSVDVAFDDIHTHLSDWEAIVRALKPDGTTDRCCKAIDDFVFMLSKKSPGMATRYHAFCERVAIYTVTNFIDAHQY